ncbi:MAG: dihydrolipoyl dehydrogenase [Anaerolineaceae bacterium]
MEIYDVVVIGAGPSGQSCAVRVAQQGGKVAIVERDFIGGICTNWGCTPSKSMIESAKVAQIVKESEKYGVDVDVFCVNFSNVAKRRNRVVETVREEIRDLLEHQHVDIYYGQAEPQKDHTILIHEGKLDVDGESMHFSGKTETIRAKNIVFATGSQPLDLPSFNKNDPSIVSSNRLISVNTLPKSLAIIGGGVIGLEFATIFTNLGSKVTIIEFLDRVAAGMDEDISATITEILEKKGVSIFTGHEAFAVDHGSIQIRDRKTGQEKKIKSDLVLVAIGRKPVILTEALENLGVEYSKKGITVNEFMQTDQPDVWAIGDATGKSILAHVGMQQGIICGENIMAGSNELRKMDYSVIPAVVYSIPEIAIVGTVPAEEKDVTVVKIPFSVNLRATIEDYREGFIKLWISEGKLLAAQAIGHNVSEIIQEFANMIALGTPIEDVAKIIHAHPSYTESARLAFSYALGKAVDFYL